MGRERPQHLVPSQRLLYLACQQHLQKCFLILYIGNINLSFARYHLQQFVYQQNIFIFMINRIHISNGRIVEFFRENKWFALKSIFFCVSEAEVSLDKRSSKLLFGVSEQLVNIHAQTDNAVVHLRNGVAITEMFQLLYEYVFC